MGPVGPQGPQESRGAPQRFPQARGMPGKWSQLPGLFWAANPGSENIELGLNGVAMLPFGLILSGSTAMASGMPLGALGAPKRP